MLGRCSPGGEHGNGKNRKRKSFRIADRIIIDAIKVYAKLVYRPFGILSMLTPQFFQLTPFNKLQKNLDT